MHCEDAAYSKEIARDINNSVCREWVENAEELCYEGITVNRNISRMKTC